MKDEVETNKHISVLLDETIEGLNIQSDGIYVDCTLGGGGHSEQICRRLNKNGRLIGIDQDTYALERAKKRLENFECHKTYVHKRFSQLEEILDELEINQVDGIVYDLGVSSFQFDQADRGFSYHQDGPLDMRMNRNQQLTAEQVVNTYSKESIQRILKEYGEERYSGRIAGAIVREREIESIQTTHRLAEIIKAAYPIKERYKDKHPARKTFQALRIEVNCELEILEKSFHEGIDALRTGGRLCVITFHSLEDRITKKIFKALENPCTCPSDFPMCVCNKKPTIKRITRKPIEPGEEELEDNRRSRSAKLRIIEKI